MEDDHDDPGQPEASGDPGEPASRTAPDAAEQTLSLNTQQVAQQLGVDTRTVRRYISEGIKTAGGAVLRLKARQIRSGRGPEWHVYQIDLDAFNEERDRLATEGQSSQLSRSGVAVEESIATSMQIFGQELERRSNALIEANATIERLAYEAGRQQGRNEELERQLLMLRERVVDLEAQVQQVQQQQTQKSLAPRRMRLLPWRTSEE